MTTTAADTSAIGKVISAAQGKVIFSPAGTNYEMHLAAPAFSGPVGVPVRGVVRVKARKIYTVPSGGLFVEPIFGSPRNIQGRIVAVDSKSMVIRAGQNVAVDFPDDETAFEMVNGGLTVGTLVKVTCWPGATFETR